MGVLPAWPAYDRGPDGSALVNDGVQVRRATAPGLTRDQSAFAIRVSPWSREIIPGLQLSATSRDLTSGFTNVYSLRADRRTTDLRTWSARRGAGLASILAEAGARAACNGGFSFISDDPGYQPVEPRLNLCVDDGRVWSLPTTTRNALVKTACGPRIQPVRARGTLWLGEHHIAWTGADTAASPSSPASGGAEVGRVYSAADCVVDYVESDLVGLRRRVDPATNRTPLDADGVDVCVEMLAGGLTVAGVVHGGGADLFGSSFIVRLARPPRRLPAVGDPVRIDQIDELDLDAIVSAMTIGPAVSSIGSGSTDYDLSLGSSPFHPGRRYARTLLSITERTVEVKVLDAAPLTSDFRGLTPGEMADAALRWGWNPEELFYLDGGQSSRVAVMDGSAVRPFGSMHYLRWPQPPDTDLVWIGPQGRPYHSALTLVCLEGRRDRQ